MKLRFGPAAYTGFAMVSRSELPFRSRTTGSLLPRGVCDERMGRMNGRDSRLKQLLLELDERTRRRARKERGISRRRLLGSISGSAVVAAVGLGGLMELLASGQALAVGMQITIDGVTREPDDAEETPHRHLFTVTFQVTDINPDDITGSVSGRAGHVISTSSVKEDDHFHVIQWSGVTLSQLVLSGPEDNEAGGHHHEVSIE